MADVIKIEGNTVTLVQEVVKNCGSLEDFLDKLVQSRPGIIDEIPNGCIAMSIRDNDATYIVYVPSHIATIRFGSDREYNRTMQVKTHNVFIPASVWAIQVQKSRGKYKPLQAYWHMTDEQPSSKLKQVRAFQNFLPNMQSGSNQICFGDAMYNDDMLNTDSVQKTLDGTIAAVQTSNFTDHLMDGAKFPARIKTAINEYVQTKALKKVEAKLKEIGDALIELEKSDWENMTESQVSTANNKREKLVNDRRKAIDASKTKTDDWIKNLFPFLEDWAEENKEMIENDPFKASRIMLVDVFGYKNGYITNAGERSSR